MEGLIKSAVEKIGSTLLSCILDQWKENGSRDVNMIACKVAVGEMEALLADNSDWTLANTGHRRRWKCYKEAFEDWMAQLYPPEEMEQPSHELYSLRDRILDVTFINKKCFTSKDVKDAKDLLDSVKKFVEKVSASACKPSISNNPCRISLVTRLLAGESILYERTTQGGSETRRCLIRPVHLGVHDRGVEAALRYKYSDQSRPGEDFTIQLFLRFSESTDIVGIAIQCFKSLQSQLKLLQYKSAISGLQLVAGSQGTVTSWRANPYDDFEERYIESTLRSRPDSFCCRPKAVRRPRADSTVVVPSRLSDMFPEEVIRFDFSCIAGAAVDYKFGSTSKDVMPPLEVNLAFSPHLESRGLRGGFVSLQEMRRKELHTVPSLQQFLKIVESNATKCFAQQKDLNKYSALWRGNHGAAHIVVKKSMVLRVMRRCFEAVKVKPWAHDPEMDDNQVLSLVSRLIQKRLLYTARLM